MFTRVQIYIIVRSGASQRGRKTVASTNNYSRCNPRLFPSRAGYGDYGVIARYSQSLTEHNILERLNSRIPDRTTL